MKLASLKEGRDGHLVVVSRDLSHACSAASIAPTLQAALDDWERAAPCLQARYETLNRGGVRQAFAFEPRACASPLPRAFQWLDGSAYVNHVELVRRARGAEMPESFWHDPLMYQGGSDAFIGPCDPIRLADASWDCDLESEIAVVTDEVPQGADPERAEQLIRLVMLANDVSLRGLIPAELAKGFGFLHGKPPTAFSPVALTPDELGGAWDGRRLSLPLMSYVNGELFGRPNAGVDMTFDFPTLIAHAAKTRPLGPGTIVGSGTVSNRDLDGGPGRSVVDGGLGYSCIAEVRMVETIRDGEPQTPFLAVGDTVSIEMVDDEGVAIFGRIEQEVVHDQTHSA